jgi:alpha-L-fucosidase 2
MKFTRGMLIILLAVSSVVWADAWDQWTLQYSQPAAQWTDALPLGNGHMGAMVFGDPQQEHIQFNVNTSGGTTCTPKTFSSCANGPILS